MQKRDEFHPQVLPLEGKVSPQATEEVSYREAVRFDGCKRGTKITSPVIRLAGDAGCHPPLQGRDFTRSPFRWTQKRDEFHSQVLPLEGKVSPQATEEVSYRIAARFDGCRSGTSSTQSFPLRGRCRRRRRKRCRTDMQSAPNGRRSATKITSPVIRLAGDAGCHPPLQGRDFARSPFRRTQKRNEFHPVLPLEGKVSPLATEEVSYRIAVCFDGCKSGTKITSPVIRLAGDAGCHPPLKGRDFARRSVPVS